MSITVTATNISLHLFNFHLNQVIAAPLLELIKICRLLASLLQFLHLRLLNMKIYLDFQMWHKTHLACFNITSLRVK